VAQRIKLIGLAVLAAAYPFLAAFLVQQGWSGPVLGVCAALAARRAVRAGPPALRAAHGVLAALLMLGALAADALAAKLIPTAAYLSLAALFGHTLRHPPSLIERLVRLQFPEFKPGIAEYLRQLTGVWTGLFVASAVISALLALFAAERAWMLYTGVWVYLLMGALGVGEFFYRPRRFPDLDRPSPADSVKVLLRDGHRVFRELRG
jgi:uncharacterized membrane protein